jgi:hypothetical protein
MGDGDLSDLRYCFDNQPFECDVFSHIFRAIADANAGAGQASGGNRDAVREAVDAMIAEQLNMVFPALPAPDRDRLAGVLPDAVRHPHFGPAWRAVRDNSAYWSPVMAVPADVEVAIVLAGLGIAAAPLFKSPPISAAPPSADVDDLVGLFYPGHHYLVGFEPAAQDHYFLVSASVPSLRRCLKTDPAFREVRKAFGKKLDRPSSGPTGTWGAYPKAPGQRLSSVGHRDGAAGDLTTLFIGGWMENGAARDDGGPTIQPIPMRIVEHLMRYGMFAMTSLMRRAGFGQAEPGAANDRRGRAAPVGPKSPKWSKEKPRPDGSGRGVVGSAQSPFRRVGRDQIRL